jgi:hypothetical protein
VIRFQSAFPIDTECCPLPPRHAGAFYRLLVGTEISVEMGSEI